MCFEGATKEELQEIIDNWKDAEEDYPELRAPRGRKPPPKLTEQQKKNREFDRNLPTDPAGYLAAIRTRYL